MENSNNQNFYHQNIILSLYVASILTIGLITNTFSSVPLELIVFSTLIPHLLEVLMKKIESRLSKLSLWFGLLTNAISFPFFMYAIELSPTITGIYMLLLSYQALVHTGYTGWCVMTLICVLGGYTAFSLSSITSIDQAPFQLVLVAIACGLFFVFHSAGNAFENLKKIKSAKKDIEFLASQRDKWVKTISRYLSPKIVHEIVNDNAINTEGYRRKPLTIFFSDVVGFTSISEKISTEELAYFLNDYLSEMSEIANRYGATIDKFIGDGIMIFFGDPVSKGPSEDCRLAIDMAIEMQKAMVSINARWSRMGFKYKFNIRMGIHSGVATAGNFGSSSQMNYTAIGSNVNIAARLEQACPESGILISKESKDLVSNLYHFGPERSLSLKGISNKFSAYCVNYMSEELDSDKTKTPDGKDLSGVMDSLNKIREIKLDI